MYLLYVTSLCILSVYSMHFIDVLLMRYQCALSTQIDVLHRFATADTFAKKIVCFKFLHKI